MDMMKGVCRYYFLLSNSKDPLTPFFTATPFQLWIGILLTWNIKMIIKSLPGVFILDLQNLYIHIDKFGTTNLIQSEFTQLVWQSCYWYNPLLTTQCSSNDWREREKIEAIYIYSESGGYVPSHQSLLSSWWYVITIKPRSECTESCCRIGGQQYLTNLSPGGGWGPARTQRYKLPEIFEEDLLTIPDICHFFYTSRF